MWKGSIKLIKEYFNTGCSFNQETTLTGKSILKNIHRAKTLGYEVHLYYVGVENVETALERIEKRVNEGGHGINAEDVIRRYDQSFENLSEVFRYCDQISLFDNSNEIDLIAKFKIGNLVFKSNSIPKWLKEMILWPICIIFIFKSLFTRFLGHLVFFEICRLNHWVSE